jgi:hypothetical protein
MEVWEFYIPVVLIFIASFLFAVIMSLYDMIKKRRARVKLRHD